jgi:hypothetical protein
VSNTYSYNAKQNLNSPNTKETLSNLQTDIVTGTLKTNATLNRDAWNAQVTHQCHRKEISNHVQCALCGSNRLANYKNLQKESRWVFSVYATLHSHLDLTHATGCKLPRLRLQKETYPPLCPKIYPSACTNQTKPIHTTRSNICSNNKTKFLRSHKYRARARHKTISTRNQRYAAIKKYDEKRFLNEWEL